MSTLLIANESGSKELIQPLKRLGLPVEATTHAVLPFGDVAFMGRGEGGAPLLIGIELKKIGELVQSLRSKRFQGHQLLGLTKDFDRRYLLIEGDYHHDDQGRAVVFRGAGRPKPLPGVTSAVALEQEVLNIQTRGGCWVRHTTTRRDTLRFILACYRYWTDRNLDEHRSHLAIYAPDLDRGLFTPRTLLRQIAAQLPGIGFKTSGLVEKHFKSVQQMVNAPVEEWVKIDGIGRKTATEIVVACQKI